jgi:hypothetical protein
LCFSSFFSFFFKKFFFSPELGNQCKLKLLFLVCWNVRFDRMFVSFVKLYKRCYGNDFFFFPLKCTCTIMVSQKKSLFFL